MLHRVEEPTAAYRVGGFGYANALIERPIKRGESEIADHPAIGKVIIENKQVTVVRATQGVRSKGEKGIVGGWASEGIPFLSKTLNELLTAST